MKEHIFLIIYLRILQFLIEIYQDKALKILEILINDPFQHPPSYEKLVGDLKGAYSRRINVRHRIVYQVLKKDRIVKVIRMWTHYE